jgi:hypothetical protein
MTLKGVTMTGEEFEKELMYVGLSESEYLIIQNALTGEVGRMTPGAVALQRKLQDVALPQEGACWEITR